MVEIVEVVRMNNECSGGNRMNNFTYCGPTKYLFGKEMEKKYFVGPQYVKLFILFPPLILFCLVLIDSISSTICSITTIYFNTSIAIFSISNPA